MSSLDNSRFVLHRSAERAKKYGEVFTPPEIVKQVISLVENYIIDIHKTILEPSCGNGNFLVSILEKRISIAKNDREKLIGLSNIYGIDILEDNVIETKNRLIDLITPNIETKQALEMALIIIDKNIIHGDFITMKYANSNESIVIYRYNIPENIHEFSFTAHNLRALVKQYGGTLF